MPEKEILIIDVTPQEKERIEALAHQHGFNTPGEYLLALVDAQEDEPTKEELLSDLRHSIHEAMTGQTIPASDFLAALESDD